MREVAGWWQAGEGGGRLVAGWWQAGEGGGRLVREVAGW